jgi:cystathionine beta-lyase/cystathionine gamma-synthase
MMIKAEGGENASAFASGMAAISSSVLSFVKPGDRLVCVENVYPDTYRFFERILRPLGIDTHYYPTSEFETNPELLSGAALAFLESPTSMLFKTLDLRKVAEHAKRHQVITIIDNSWATPMFQRPIALGVDLVIHSASKYISGHSDTVAGITIGRQTHIAQIRDLAVPLLGAKLGPFEAWLLVRGLRTLCARMNVHQASALYFIDKLSASKWVKRIYAPGPDTANSLTGQSGLFSIELDPRVDIRRLCDQLKLFKMGVSWGGFESLILPALVGLAQPGEFNPMQRFNVPDNLVRLSLGLENAEDLWADFDAALCSSIK